MLPDRVSNQGPLTYESGVLPIALRGPATIFVCQTSRSGSQSGVRDQNMSRQLLRKVQQQTSLNFTEGYMCQTSRSRSQSGVRDQNI